MSGIAVAYGKPDEHHVSAMMAIIKHRGPYAEGTFTRKKVAMGQNYLLGDVAPNQGEMDIPARTHHSGDFRICYDGQMGNWEKLALSRDISDGPLREERLLLNLYQEKRHNLFEFLEDAIFSFVISDGEEFLAARDTLGIKTLFYGYKNGTLYLASELKSLIQVTDDVHEFPPGHFMDRSGDLVRYAELPAEPPGTSLDELNTITENIRNIIRRSIENRVSFSVPTGSLLSGGIDSSVITALACEVYRNLFGKDARLKTFALGVGESEDIRFARIVADSLKTDHHELIVGLDEILSILPKVIYYLESFDPSLVRSSLSNYLISRYASEHGIEIILSGEGGDEIFCGYTYLKQFREEELFARQMECMHYLHNNASLRLDRMNQCHSLRVVAPLISGELLQYTLTLPSEYKQKQDGKEKVEKWIFRKAFESLLPAQVVWRLKKEFSQGSGSAQVLPEYFENVISDEKLKSAQAKHRIIRSKEELYYFQIFSEYFGEGKSIDTVGQWVSL